MKINNNTPNSISIFSEIKKMYMYHECHNRIHVCHTSALCFLVTFFFFFKSCLSCFYFVFVLFFQCEFFSDFVKVVHCCLVTLGLGSRSSPSVSHRQTRLLFASPARCAATSGTGGCPWRCGTGTARPGTTSWGRCPSA